MSHCVGLDNIRCRVEQHRLSRMLRLVMCDCERCGQFKARGGNGFRFDIPDSPRACHVGVQVPEKALKAMMEYVRRPRRPPKDIRLALAVEGAAQEIVEATDMVHVQVGEE